MKDFSKRYSYVIVKLIVNYFIFSIFGLSFAGAVSLAYSRGEGDPTALLVISSVVAVLLYCLISYGEIWKAGDADTLVVADGELRYNKLTGLFIGLFASIPNIIISLLSLLVSFWPKQLDWLSGILVVVNFIFNGMWRGVMILGSESQALGSFWWFYLLICLPTLVIGFLGYLNGVNGRHLTRIFIPENAEEREIKREKKKSRSLSEDEDN